MITKLPKKNENEKNCQKWIFMHIKFDLKKNIFFEVVKRDTAFWALPVTKLQFISSKTICLIFFLTLSIYELCRFFHVSCRETPCIVFHWMKVDIQESREMMFLIDIRNNWRCYRQAHKCYKRRAYKKPRNVLSRRCHQ